NSNRDLSPMGSTQHGQLLCTDVSSEIGQLRIKNGVPAFNSFSSRPILDDSRFLCTTSSSSGSGMHNPTTVRDRDAPLTSGHTITVGGQLGETPGSETTLSTQQPLAMVEVQRRPSSSRRPSTPDG